MTGIFDTFLKKWRLRRNQEEHWKATRYRGPYDPVFRAYAEPKLKLIQNVLNLEDKSVLDVGCGPGNFTVLLAELAGQVTGCDSSEHMLQKAAELHGMDFRQGDATNLPFDDDSFDIAFEANLLHHTDRPKKVLDEMVRVAKSAIVLIEPNACNPVMFAFSLLIPAERGGLKSTRSFIESLARQAGAKIIGHWTTGMISQNNTPSFLVPMLRFFDRDFPFAEYQVLAATLDKEKTSP